MYLSEGSGCDNVKGEEISEALLSAGGMGYATDREAQPVEGGWMVRAPLIILDDESFRSYCEQIGVVGICGEQWS